LNIEDLHIEKFEGINTGRIFNFAQMAESYENYAQNIQGRKVSVAIKSFDNALGMVRPSQVVTFIGGTNVGKTAIAMNACFHNAERLQDSLILLLECEVDENEIYERALQMEFDLHTYEVEQAYINQDKDLLDRFKSIRQKYSNVISVIERIHVDKIIPYVKAIEDFYSKRVGLLLIDYVGLLKNEFRDDYGKITYSMQKLKEIAIALQVPIINLSQTSRLDIKDHNGGSKKIGLYAGKGSGEVENSSQVLITLNRVTELTADQTVTTEVMNKISGDKPTHYLLEAKIEKKKQGDYASTFLLFNKKNLKLEDLTIVEENPF